MNTTPASNSRKDGILAAIAVLVMLLGAATGNAVAMLAIAAGGLAVIAISSYRQKLGRTGLMAITLAGTIAFFVAIAIANF